MGSFTGAALNMSAAERMYEYVARPFMRKTQKNIYRSYKWTNVENLQLVRYKWDISNIKKL